MNNLKEKVVFKGVLVLSNLNFFLFYFVLMKKRHHFLFGIECLRMG